MSTTDEHGGSLDATRAAPAPPAPDGDDIEVLPDALDTAGPARRRWLVGAGALVAILVVAGVVALVTRDTGAKAPTVRTLSPGPTAPPVVKARPTTVARTPKTPPARVATTVPSTNPTAVTTPHVLVPAPTNPTVPPPPVTAATTAAPPKQYGASVLTWSAPSHVTIPTGSSAPVSVTAHNPTDGTVELPHLLSCTPRLDHSEMCAQVVQSIPAGAGASAIYTIDARDIAPGTYQLHIEGVLTVTVTVSAPAPTTSG